MSRPSALKAIVEIGQGEVGGVVRETSSLGVLVAFLESTAPVLRVGGASRLRLIGGDLDLDVRCLTKVMSRSQGQGFVLYRFTFDDLEAFLARLPASLREQFDRRSEPRLPAPPGRRVPVEVLTSEGDDAGRRFIGVLVDISHGGLGVELESEADRALANSATAVCRFQPPGREREVVRACEILNRTLFEGSIRYGMSFVRQRERVETGPVPSFEPVWDCDGCGTRQLLALTHLFCPGCGTKRGDKHTYFPAWDEVLQEPEHWASGSERMCAFCANEHGELATHCGRCGKILP